MSGARTRGGVLRRARRTAERAALVLLLTAGFATPGEASPVVLLGDSWGALIGASVRGTLDAEGHAALGLHNASVGGSTAAQWNAGAFGSMEEVFADHGDARLVHVILGGNDLIGGADDPLTAIDQASADTLDVLRDVAGATSAPILFSGYEYLPGSLAGFDPSLVNLFLDTYVGGLASSVAADPLLASRVTVVNTHGLMQVHFGVPQEGIPAFDPSLPDPSLPGPDSAFADAIHLNRAGYDVLADQLYQDFYGPVLVPEPGATALLLAAGIALHRARRRARA